MKFAPNQCRTKRRDRKRERLSYSFCLRCPIQIGRPCLPARELKGCCFSVAARALMDVSPPGAEKALPARRARAGWKSAPPVAAAHANRPSLAPLPETSALIRRLDARAPVTHSFHVRAQSSGACSNHFKCFYSCFLPLIGKPPFPERDLSSTERVALKFRARLNKRSPS